MKRKSLVLGLLIIGQIAFGQKALLISTSNSELIDDDLLSVSVDTNGDKWIGTSKFGLVRHQKDSFSNFDKTNSEIKGDYIAPIFTDSKGRV